MSYIPSYTDLYNSGELRLRTEKALQMLKKCNICPRECLNDRIQGDPGYCLSGYLPIVSSYTEHFGEEPVLSGSRGAGNIFFGNCNLRCIFCQNYEISQNYKKEQHREVTFEKLADTMLELQSKNCHNIGLVSPSHFSAQILASIEIAVSKGLHIPIIYNSNGYDSVEMLKLYDGVADIYLPDLKYGDNNNARVYSKAGDYFDKARYAIKEMYRQVGSELVYDGNVITRGLIIRHLVLPNGLAESETVFRFIAEELSPDVHISLMSQYYPTFRASEEILLSRTIRESEYQRTIELMEKYGLRNGWIQEPESSHNYRPEFNRDRVNPFV